VSTLRRQRLGRLLAGLYLLAVPIMPVPEDWVLRMPLPRLQPVDALAPAIVGWLAWTALAERGLGRLCHALLTLAALFALSPVVGAALDRPIALADLGEAGKRLYLGLVLAFFVWLWRRGALDRAFQRFALCWAGLLLLLSLGLYLHAAATGRDNFAVNVWQDYYFLGNVVALRGPFSPTSKLLSVYVLLLGWSALAAQGRLSRSAAWAFALLCAIAATLTLSRSGCLALLFLVLALLARQPRASVWLALAALPALLAILALQAVTITYSPNLEAAFACGLAYAADPAAHAYGPMADGTECRFRLAGSIVWFHYWQLKWVALQAWTAAPWFGAGAGGFQATLEALRADGALPAALRSYFSAQSSYLSLAAESGFAGLAAWLGLLALPLATAWRQRTDPAAGRVMCLAIAALAIVAVDLDIQNFRFLYALLPLALAAAVPDSVSR